MIGAHDFGAGKNSIQFRFRGCARYNKVQISAVGERR